MKIYKKFGDMINISFIYGIILNERKGII